MIVLAADDTITLPLLYHLNSEPWVNEQGLERTGYEVQYSENTHRATTVALPLADDTPLMNLLRQRFSCRNYLDRSMPLSELAAVLSGTYAIVRVNQLRDGSLFCSRAVPSAGGLYPLEVYVALQRVQGLEDGLYRYDVPGHGLEPLRSDARFNELSTYLIGQYFLQQANAIVIFAAVFERNLVKYGARGYRYILLEAGHAAQNLCLLASERGLGSLCMGGFFDAKLNQLIGLDGVSEAAIYCVGLGYPAE